jgi:hypothetical protein
MIQPSDMAVLLIAKLMQGVSPDGRYDSHKMAKIIDKALCDAVKPYGEALKKMHGLAKETRAQWDKDQDSKVGKWLAAMSGCKGIRDDADEALAVLEHYITKLEAR